VPVRDRANHFFTDELGPERRTLRGARRTEAPLLARECDEELGAARVAPDPREAALGETTSEEPLDRLRDDVPQRTEVPLEPLFVLAGEPIEELVEDGIDRVLMPLYRSSTMVSDSPGEASIG
jgi:hypothetical protein